MKKIDYDFPVGITAFTVLRNSDSYHGKYGGFNTCHYVDDTPEHVTKCRHDLADELGIENKSLIIPFQKHTANVIRLDNFAISDEELDGIDALVTDIPGKALVIHTADCLPIFLADPVAGVVALAHGGWKGLVAGILENTVAEMINVGAKPKRIIVRFGPNISSSNYEIGNDIIEKFNDDEVVKENGKTFLNLRTVAVNHLLKVGVDRDNIMQESPCTFTDKDNFYSARREGLQTGRLTSVIMLDK